MHRHSNGHFAKIGLTRPGETPKFGFREMILRNKMHFFVKKA